MWVGTVEEGNRPDGSENKETVFSKQFIPVEGVRWGTDNGQAHV